MPGISLSINSAIDSGVISLGDKPVPPVNKIKSKCSSTNFLTVFCMAIFSSGMIE
jgi:hypothetical protein